MDLLAKLTGIPGIPGREEKVAEFYKSQIEGLVDSVDIDVMGNVIGFRKGKTDKKIMIAAHMDEIGFIVKHIDKNGFIRLHNAGGFDPRTLIAQTVKVYGKEELTGVIGIKPTHILSEGERKKGIEIKDLFVDTGYPGEEVKELVEIGDMVTLQRSLTHNKYTVTTKILDDRIGLYMIIKALERLKDEELNCSLYAVGSVQEEVGLRGATTSSYNIDPNYSIALDVTIACDTPGARDDEAVTKLGEGVGIKLMDGRSISHREMVTKAKEVAKANDIKYQLEILPRGGTDAGAMQRARSGSKAITFSLPVRYVHSVVETASKEDLKASIDLLVEFIKSLD